jgi:hypothetical protein
MNSHIKAIQDLAKGVNELRKQIKKNEQSKNLIYWKKPNILDKQTTLHSWG